MKIVWSPLALARAGEISAYTATDNPPAAARWIEAIFTKVEQLQLAPQSGRVVPEVGNPEIRELIYGNYRIIYRVERRWVAILTIRHGKQQLPTADIVA